MFCKKCGKEINNDQEICVDCFHKELFDLKKPLKESTVRNFSLLRFILLFIFTMIVIAIIAARFIPSANGDIKSSQKRLALNIAATVAQSVATLYANSNYDKFVGLSSEYGESIKYQFHKCYTDYKLDVKIPEGYKCTILDSMIVVSHKDGAKGEVTWR